MKLTIVLVLILAFAFTSSAYGQKFLQKSYKEWSQDEVAKILKDGPWSGEYQSEEGLIAAQRVQQARESADNNRGSYRGNQGRLDIPVPITIRLHSALPVRQAMVRLQQIGANYDKMSAEDKQKFDGQTAKFLECAICENYYVVTIEKWKDTSSTVSEGIFQTMTLADLKGKVWLVNDKDEKLELEQFSPPKSAVGQAVFFFKRANEPAAPFFTSRDKQVRFVFSNELRNSDVNAYGKLIPKSFEFKVAKMLNSAGELEF
jgi:hypothetical protein